jgi:SEC-C motif-containing protein
MAPKTWPSTPQALLEARYQAFVEANIDFIVSSHHAETRDQLDRESLEAWAKDSQWLGLKIEALREEGDKAFITFTVRYSKDAETVNHREDAEFRRTDGQWFYYDSVFPKPVPVRNSAERVGRNDPCPCGSGKKYKKCHFLNESAA